MINAYTLYYTLERLYTSIARHLPGGYALPPLQVVFELTYRCNLKCEMCYQRRQVDQLGARRSDKARELSADEIKRLVRRTPWWSLIVFTGGEPLLRQDALDIIAYTARRRRCHIVTNGVALGVTPETAGVLVEAGVMSVGISLDGDQATHDAIRGVPGTFDRTLRGIQALWSVRNERGRAWPLINVKSVITRANAARLGQIVDLATEAGADFCTFQMQNNSIHLSGLMPNRDISLYTARPDPIEDFDVAALKGELAGLAARQAGRPIVRFIPDLPPADYILHYENRAAPTDYLCQTPWATANISAYGDVFPCLNYAIGNVREKELARLWNNSRFRAFRQALRADGLFPGCIGCCDLRSRHCTRRGVEE